MWSHFYRKTACFYFSFFNVVKTIKEKKIITQGIVSSKFVKNVQHITAHFFPDQWQFNSLGKFTGQQVYIFKTVGLHNQQSGEGALFFDFRESRLKVRS